MLSEVCSPQPWKGKEKHVFKHSIDKRACVQQPRGGTETPKSGKARKLSLISQTLGEGRKTCV